MIKRPDLDRELPAYLEWRSTDRVPAGLLDRALDRVPETRQRPGWLVPEHWVPDFVARRRSWIPSPTLAVVAVLLILAAMAVALFVGSQRRLPPPFGLARPGSITFDVAGDIFVANADGTGRTQLTVGPDADSYPTFSPDGTRIAYLSELADHSTAVIVMDADGRHPVAVIDRLWVAGALVGKTGFLAWSPDGRRLAVAGRPAITPGSTDVDSGLSRIYVADLDGAGTSVLGGPDMYGEDLSWSPDGSTIAFAREYPCCGGPAGSIWLIAVDGSSARPLTTSGGRAVTWSPDGSRLAYLAEGPDASDHVHVINADGSDDHDVSGPDGGEPSWSPDGTRIAFARSWNQYGNKASIVLVQPDGSRIVTLPGPFVIAAPPIWSPDGTRLLGLAFEKPGMVGYDWGTVDAIVALDPSGRSLPTSIPISGFYTTTWQRRAP